MSADPNPFTARWRSLVSEATLPRYLRKVQVMRYPEFQARIRAHDLSLVDDVYAGDVLMLKGTLDERAGRDLCRRAFEWSKALPSSFHKIVDGSPDFHRIIDPQTTQAYASQSMRHAYYYYRWNGDPVGIFALMRERWRMFKYFSGLAPDQYETNLPRDLVVDRLILYQYPLGTGGLKVHADPINNQKLVMGGFLSKRGVDYKVGGIYFVRPDESKEDMEPYVDPGDFMLVFPTVLHGVDTVDPGATLDWQSPGGRWFIGPASIDSDYVQNRQTTVTY